MRKAYLIGNGNYENEAWRKLDYSISDIDKMEKSLTKCDFIVECFKDVDKYTLTQFLQMEGNFNEYDTVLIYYSGHGFEENGDAYLVPVDATDSTVSCVKITDLLAFIEDKVGIKCILILDCCRVISGEDNNILKKEIEKLRSRQDAFICFSTTFGNSAIDDNGIFAAALSEFILEDKLCIEKVFKKVRNNVITESKKILNVYWPGKKQITCEYSTLLDEFYFIHSDINKRVNQYAKKINLNDDMDLTKKWLRDVYDFEMGDFHGSIDFNTFKTKVYDSILDEESLDEITR